MSSYPLSRRLVPLALLLFLGMDPVVQAQEAIVRPVEGELKRWHKLTFDFADADDLTLTAEVAASAP